MRNLGFVVLWGIALVQSANALFFCLRTNPCWGALGVVGGLLDCLGNLVVTVTPPAVTQTKTITAIVSAVDTVTVTTSTTATVATSTILFTETTTTTASTATNTVLQTSTVFTTLTSTETAPPIVTTTTIYGSVLEVKKMARDVDVVARGNNPYGIPDYAWPACQDWDHYVDACKCFGINPITITKQPTAKTVTVTASNAITTTVSTLTTTTTNTVPVTATTSATFTAVVEVIASATITQTVTVTSTAIVTTTTAPTVTSTQGCKPTGVPFRIKPQIEGAEFVLADLGDGTVVWVNFGSGADDPQNVALTTFVLNENGFLETFANTASGIGIDTNLSETSERFFAFSEPAIDNPAMGYVRIKGCIDPITSIISLSADGRSNILSCSFGIPYLSSGDGTDVASRCDLLFPPTEAPP
ncbi:hypothetical protein NEMBOFW57_009381 [Staphylotrichum longicolle]|uniref:Uncharacterized protein n=1 Tax=Staphylotrichum longicolle TaxID=669026 RepID=A0AAD4EPA3_9PEZI|nr:hypothetical protein NEMBOFW57_009381 [Staphylotrichum longicolle]